MRGNVKGVALPNCTAKNKQKSKKLFITLQNMVVKSSPSLNSITTLGLCLPTISGVFLNLLDIASFHITDFKRRIVHGEKDCIGKFLIVPCFRDSIVAVHPL